MTVISFNYANGTKRRNMFSGQTVQVSDVTGCGTYNYQCNLNV